MLLTDILPCSLTEAAKRTNIWNMNGNGSVYVRLIDKWRVYQKEKGLLTPSPLLGY